MKKAVFVALFALISLRAAIWAVGEFGSGPSVPQVSSQGVRTETQASVAQPTIPAREIASAATPASKKEDEPIAPALPPPLVKTGDKAGNIIQPMFDLPFEAISQYLKIKPSASIEDVVVHLNKNFKGRLGVPMSFYLDGGATDAKAAVEVLDLPDGGKLGVPHPVVNACKRQEYLLGAKSFTKNQAEIALMYGHVKVKMPKGFVAAKLTSVRKGTRISTVYGPVGRPPLNVSLDGKQFYYFVYLPQAEPFTTWWKAQQKVVSKDVLPAPFLVYSISEQGIEFSPDPNLYKSATYMPPSKVSPKDPTETVLTYDHGFTVEANNVCTEQPVTEKK